LGGTDAGRRAGVYTFTVGFQKGDAMNLLLVLMFSLTSLAWAQSAPPQAPPSSTSGAQATSGGPGSQMGAERRPKMMEMHKQHMQAMKADLEKVKASLDQMKANLTKISDPAEKERWQVNVDMWQVMVGHMEQMMKHMESMGPGGAGMGPDMMHHKGMGGPPSPPPAEKKPQ